MLIGSFGTQLFSFFATLHQTHAAGFYERLLNVFYKSFGLNVLMAFALNLNPRTNDARRMTPGTGTFGLPVATMQSGPRRLEVEFVRRRAAGTPGITCRFEFTNDASNPAGWVAGGTESVTPIDQVWERVKVTDIQSAAPRRYGRLKVTRP